MKWLDARLHKPSCNALDKYTVVVILVDNIITVGRAVWHPTADYTDGEWGEFENTNGNKHGILPVLFWQEHPSPPKVLKNVVVRT